MRRVKSVHEVLWASMRPWGVEHCVLAHETDGFSLTGTVVRGRGKGRATLVYRISTDAGWRTRSLVLEQLGREGLQKLEMEVRDGVWKVDGKEMVSLQGCVDVDLNASPSTNTLPIRRSKIGVGSKANVRAAWVRFPRLEVLPLEQSYERLGERRYLYRSASGFSAEVEVDGQGLVRRYGDYWVAV